MNVRFEVNIESGHVAMVSDPETAIRDILREIEDELYHNGFVNGASRVIREVNGNRVGTWRFTLEEDE